ncbi:MAG: hypothetical protein EZS28_018955 [Streblomastix strix]|uniref:Tail specific protease domain-containing protein n=1 Tax=Streblomastix strix TaxID=222440 RepID=A0A5J4VSD3_9EUKA|nr:MAG: hypothetical protein EZS28_018955 [Streblomastix strix]
MATLFLLVLALVCDVAAQCKFKNGQVQSLSSGLDCFRSIPINYSSVEFTSTIKLLETYLQSYVFIDTALNPNQNGSCYNQKPVDLLFSLRDIKKETYINTYDFYERLMVLFNDLKDAHTYFEPPCLNKFAFVLPYYFSIYPSSNNTQIVKVSYKIDPAFALYNTSGNVIFDQNTEILQMNLKGKTIYNNSATKQLNVGSYKASEAIAYWADEEVYHARSPITRQNIASRGDFSYRQARLYPHPKYDNISVEYKLSNGTINVTTLPWYVLQTGNVSSFESECPLDSKFIKSSQNIETQKNNKEKKQLLILKKIKNLISTLINKKKQKISIVDNFEDFTQLQRQLELEEIQQTQQLEERFSTQINQYISQLPDLKTNTSINNNNKQNKDFKQFPKSSVPNADVSTYYLNDSKTGVIRISTFAPSSDKAFANSIYKAVDTFKDKTGKQFADKIIIDVHENGGGVVIYGTHTLRFLFPQSNFPIFPTIDELRSPLNAEFSKISEYIMNQNKGNSQLYYNPDTYEMDINYYSRGGRRRQTYSSLNDGNSLNVDLSEKSYLYGNHINSYINLTNKWSLNRKPLFNPQDVLVLTDGMCASTCAQFVKAIQQQHLARIVGVGINDPRNPNLRYEIGIAASGASTTVESIQQRRNDNSYTRLMNISKIPGPFYRSGTKMGFANKGLYGYTDATKDKLMEYEVVDPDFRYQSATNYGEGLQNEDEKEYLEYLKGVLELEEELLGNKNGSSEGKKCLSWEVDFDDAGQKGNCRGCLKGDQHSVFGYPCSTRGFTEKDGRNIDGTSKIGVYDTSKCVFSHCIVGYYRKRVNVNGTLKDQCIAIPLGYNETRSEVTPDQSEDIVKDDDICGSPDTRSDPCKNITSTTPTDTCACPTDSTKLQQDPRKDGLCKCAIITSTTPVNTCPCPTDPTKLQQDPRKDGLCKCAIITSTTPTDICACPTDSTKLQQDPRKDGLCKCAIITSTTPINTCACPTDQLKLQQDPRKDGLCKCAIITSTTPTNTCACPTDQSKLQQDPRKDGLCKCAIITSTTPINTCACPTDQSKLQQDPRKDGLCKIDDKEPCIIPLPDPDTDSEEEFENDEVEMYHFNFYINLKSGFDKEQQGYSESKPARTIGYTIKTLIGGIDKRGEASLHVSAENYTDNIEYRRSEGYLDLIRLIGISNEETNKSYPVLSNSAHPGQSALNIVGVGIHVKHIIFAYIPPVSFNDAISPMISINAGSLFDWKHISGGQRDKTPIRLIHSFTDCIFEGSSVDYNTKKSYGYTIGPFLSIIGASVKIDNCHFTSKENMNILKGISSVIVSAVYIYADSGITVTNCKFENLNQGKTELENALKETGIVDLIGNDKDQLQRLNNLPPSLAIFAIVDSISSLNIFNVEIPHIAVKSTQFINSYGETSRSGALLIDGFNLGYRLNQNNNLGPWQQLKFITNESPSKLPSISLDGNTFKNTKGLLSSAVALGKGVAYGLIDNNQFSDCETQTEKNALINFESEQRVIEAGGPDMIIGDGNVYITLIGLQEEGFNQLFTVEGKENAGFDTVQKKITVISEEQVTAIDEIQIDDKEQYSDKQEVQKNNSLIWIIIIIIFTSLVVIVGISALVLFIYSKIIKKQKQLKDKKELRRKELEELSQDVQSL